METNKIYKPLEKTSAQTRLLKENVVYFKAKML